MSDCCGSIGKITAELDKMNALITVLERGEKRNERERR